MCYQHSLVYLCWLWSYGNFKSTWKALAWEDQLFYSLSTVKEHFILINKPALVPAKPENARELRLLLNHTFLNLCLQIWPEFIIGM